MLAIIEELASIGGHDLDARAAAGRTHDARFQFNTGGHDLVFSRMRNSPTGRTPPRLALSGFRRGVSAGLRRTVRSLTRCSTRVSRQLDPVKTNDESIASVPSRNAAALLSAPAHFDQITSAAASRSIAAYPFSAATARAEASNAFAESRSPPEPRAISIWPRRSDVRAA